jgi:hypothetical protein
MTAIDITAAPLAEADHRSQLCRAVIASTVGLGDCRLHRRCAVSVIATLIMPDYTNRDISQEHA